MGAIIELRFALCEGSQEDYKSLLEDIGKASIHRTRCLSSSTAGSDTRTTGTRST
jgi:hypothetical protein